MGMQQMTIVIDYKQKIVVWRGPNEISAAFRARQARVCFGAVIFTRWKTWYCCCISSCLSQSAYVTKLYLKAIFKNKKNSKFNIVDNKYKINKFNRFITNNTKINDLKKKFLEKLKNTYEIKDFECKLNKIKQAILKLR